MRKLKLSKNEILLVPILILSGFLSLVNLSIEGYGNEYYAAGVKSMTMSLKNFFFVSFDPAGFVTIDKPPLGFMIQALSAKIFGYSGWSIIPPQALAGVISVWVIYKIVKRSFGIPAALISSLCLAITPIFVADSRNNTNDNLLVLVLLLACWVLSIAAEKGHLKLLILSLVLVGIGFNIKMLQAYMIVPALYITYLLSTAVSWKKRIGHLVLGTIVLLITSLSWAFIVDLVPEENRPFIGSSTDNTVMELIIGHNGLERLGLGSSNRSGQGGFGEINPQEGMDRGQESQTENYSSNGDREKPQSPQGTNGQMMQGNPEREGNMGEGKATDGSSGNMPQREGGSQGGMGFGNMRAGGGQVSNMGGSEGAGITRLFQNNSLSDQIIWLFPLALIGFIAAAIKEKLNLKLDNKKKLGLALWFTWLVPVFIYFSFTTGLFHPYYLTMLAPPIAALTGIGVISMWELYKDRGWKSWFLPGALIINAGVQLLILSYYSSDNISKILAITVFVLSGASSVVLIALNLLRNNDKKIIDKIVVSISVIGLLITPLVWSSTTMFYKMSGTFPSAGLSLRTEEIGMGNTLEGNEDITKLVDYLKSNITSEKYLVAVQSATGTASQIIINTGESVITLGGFSGSDQILTLDEFKELVNKGEIRYVITGGQGRGGNNEIMSWVQENGVLVPGSKWDNTKTSTTGNKTLNQGFGRGNSIELYDLKPGK
ncbi:glycosyltransferase family 39 protein [Clostridium sp. YIM B02506]|uniref:glycosyltransferase family 39 protein n=1 Tax=Clostridium sp. YIM B02506 TaxID=2910680 RepID=UPI001EEF4B0A|nr:glycosyltransferase family 39 protein [Clostridium sp. YIM B02506]